MYIEELKEGGDGGCGWDVDVEFSGDGAVVVSKTKRVLVGAGARALFYQRCCTMLLEKERVQVVGYHGENPNLKWKGNLRKLETDPGKQEFGAVSDRFRSAARTDFGQTRNLVNILTADRVRYADQVSLVSG